MSLGFALAMLGAVIAVVASGIGSVIGISRAAAAANGLLTKEPKYFTKVLILMLLMTSQGIYGLTVSFLMLYNLGVVGGTIPAVTVEAGFTFLLLGLPVGVMGCVSAIMQGNVAVTAINLFGKQNKMFVQCILIISATEVFALFGFLISMLGVLFLATPELLEKTAEALPAAADALKSLLLMAN